MLVQTNAQYATVIEWIQRADTIACDTETSGLNPWLGDRLTGVAIATDEGCAYLPFRHRTPLGPHASLEGGAFPEGWNLSWRYFQRLTEELSAACEGRGATLVFHHLLFDSQILRQDGWKLPSSRYWWDTKVCSWLIDENTSHRLKDLADAWIDPTSSTEAAELKELMRKRPGHDAPTWASLTPLQVAAYGDQDARLTLLLQRIQKGLCQEHPELLAAMRREMDFLGVLDRMISAGVRVDVDAIQSALEDRRRVMAEVGAHFPDINLNATAQLCTLLYDIWGLPCSRTTKGGGRSADAQALSDLIVDHPERADNLMAIMSWRKANKAAGTYFEGLLKYRSPVDGRVHPWFNSSSEERFGTHTGRCSSSAPNLQTIPKEEVLPDVRNVFIAEDGYELWEFDLQQAEMRVAADYSQDQGLVHDVQSADLHSATAVRIFGDAEPLNRRLAKALNFGFMYGAGARTFAATVAKGGMRISVEQAQEYLDQYARTYPRLVLASKETEQVARQRGLVKLWPEGRRRLYRSPALQFPRYYSAFNAIVQGGVAELVKAAMIRLDQVQDSHGARMILQIHDSIVVEIPQGTSDTWTLAVRSAFQAANPFSIPMPIDAQPWRKETTKVTVPV